MSAPKQIVFEAESSLGGKWRIAADMEGEGLGIISLSLTDHRSPRVSVPFALDELDKLVGLLRHTATSIAWIQAHGLEATFEEPPS